MSYILHLGHQTSDLSGASGRISTDAAGFDPTLDVNCIKISTLPNAAMAFAAAWRLPTADLWLGFRYVAPNQSAHLIGVDGMFLEFYDAAARLVAQIRTRKDDDKYHAQANGDAAVEGASTFIAAIGQPYWIDVRVSVGASITIQFHVDGVLQSTATAANTAGKGRPVQCIWRNSALHEYYTVAPCYYAHIAVLDGVSTIGRRFVRRRPDLIGAYNQMPGGIEALKDDDPSTRVASDIAGQRLSFSLTGPTGPAGVTSVAGVHLKQIAQAGSAGPAAMAGFLRIAGADHDAAPGTPSPDLPTALYASWGVNPATGLPWTSATLPAEVGIVSA
ncbi:hypothetical protein [Rhodobacter ferrooxidans]|uniref:Uncharacterized protein n=1 Tax=Rhodobacter ferrooxidans TaxID=371731 RepID=C8S4Q9_9RHOB|nr:hypothetical protein [Rhodobacter sp. SW2]EEW24058.1 hypothetical protein Rsw2DRAFT_3037 [Rhodobacter sp. SW2]